MPRTEAMNMYALNIGEEAQAVLRQDQHEIDRARRFVEEVNSGLPVGHYVLTMTLMGKSQGQIGGISCPQPDFNQFHGLYKPFGHQRDDKYLHHADVATKHCSVPFLGDSIQRVDRRLVLINTALRVGLTLGNSTRIINTEEEELPDSIFQGVDGRIDHAFVKLLGTVSEGERKYLP